MFKFTLAASLVLFGTLAVAAPIASRDNSGTFIGDGTFFAPGLGACGVGNTEADPIVAVSSTFFDGFGAQSNGNPICNKQIQITFGGHSVTATITDKCPGCGDHDLDMSPAVFNQLADPSVGRIHGIQWSLV